MTDSADPRKFVADESVDLRWLRRAIELSRSCPKSPRSFAVGAVLVADGERELATGFSLERGPGWHAEEVALAKARESGLELRGVTLYSSLEPCSVRLSGKPSCVSHIVQAGIARVVFAWREPAVFVEGRGEEELRRLGIEVACLTQLADEAKEVNAHLFAPSAHRDERAPLP